MRPDLSESEGSEENYVDVSKYHQHWNVNFGTKVLSTRYLMRVEKVGMRPALMAFSASTFISVIVDGTSGVLACRM